MSLTAFALVVAAACLHALWNLAAKRETGNEKTPGGHRPERDDGHNHLVAIGAGSRRRKAGFSNRQDHRHRQRGLGKVKNRTEEYGGKKRRLLYEAHFSVALVVLITPPGGKLLIENATLAFPEFKIRRLRIIKRFPRIGPPEGRRHEAPRLKGFPPGFWNRAVYTDNPNESYQSTRSDLFWP
jgi:hypothetical protein